MACNALDIPKLEFPRDEIIEVCYDPSAYPIQKTYMFRIQIIPASYNNRAKRIHIPDLPASIVPASPEDLRIPVPPSGTISPFSGIGSPANGTNTPNNGQTEIPRSVPTIALAVEQGTPQLISSPPGNSQLGTSQVGSASQPLSIKETHVHPLE